MPIYEKEELTNYHILTNIHNDKNVSQRVLSSQMGVNVSSINFAIKRLVSKGLVKMIGVNPRRIKYIVTPKGLAAKSALAYKFFDRNFHFYKDVRNDIENRIQKISNGKIGKVAIYGINQLSEITVLAIQNMGLELVGIFDGQINNKGRKFLGYNVYKLENLKNEQPSIVLLTERKNSELAIEISKEIGSILINLAGYYRIR